MKNEEKMIVPYLLEGYIVIALHPDWMKMFNGIPTFIVKISEDKRLHLISQEVIENDIHRGESEKI